MKLSEVLVTISVFLNHAFVAAQGKASLGGSENHPPLQVSRCTKAGGCVSSTQSITLDANWRWLHNSQGSNCYTGNTWNQASCPDPLTCAQQCYLDSANYQGVYGITSSGNSLRLNFVTQSANKNVGSRNYLLNSAGTQYESFNLKGKEFTFTVDVSNLPCGLNGALYFTEMPADGGLSATNTAGAPYGTGYCDAQCPHDIKFIQGQANIVNWKPDSNNPNTGKGQWGSCCAEMDVWEANSVAEAYTPHVCSNPGLHKCLTPEDCGDGANRHTGACDKDGCDFNPYRMGVQQFFGPGLVVDTTKPFTVVTQFLTADGTSASDLVEIRRSFIQNGVVHGNPVSTFASIPYDSVTDSYCAAQKSLFGDPNIFGQKGGLKAMGAAMDRGMTLVMSLWDDYDVSMLWLDSTFPTNSTAAGTKRGTCATTSGVPTDVESSSPNAYVVYSDVRWGEIGSTFNGNPVPSSSRVPSKTTTAAVSPTTASASPSVQTTAKTVVPSSTVASNCATKWGQCGGKGWTGPTCCVASTCTYNNDWYSQCL